MLPSSQRPLTHLILATSLMASLAVPLAAQGMYVDHGASSKDALEMKRKYVLRYVLDVSRGNPQQDPAIFDIFTRLRNSDFKSEASKAWLEKMNSRATRYYARRRGVATPPARTVKPPAETAASTEGGASGAVGSAAARLPGVRADDPAYNATYEGNMVGRTIQINKAGRMLMLDDESLWRIAADDVETSLTWKNGHPLNIVNLGKGRYRLYNSVAGGFVTAGLVPAEAAPEEEEGQGP